MGWGVGGQVAGWGESASARPWQGVLAACGAGVAFVCMLPLMSLGGAGGSRIASATTKHGMLHSLLWLIAVVESDLACRARSLVISGGHDGLRRGCGNGQAGRAGLFGRRRRRRKGQGQGQEAQVNF